MAHIIESTNVGGAWLKCLRKVLADGTVSRDKTATVKELLNVHVAILRPHKEDAILRQFGERAKIDWMRENFFGKRSTTPYGYNYRQRLFNYGAKDQVSWIVKRLRDNLPTKSATITLLKPGADDGHVPCLVALDFKFRGSRLALHCFFRSQDIYNKMYADILQLSELQRMVAAALDRRAGSLFLTVVSAHVYKNDYAAARELLRKARPALDGIS